MSVFPLQPLWNAHHKLVRLPRIRRVVDAFAELSNVAGSVLDVGAGDGAVGRAYADRVGATVQGIDIFPPPDSAVPVTAYDGTNLPFADQSFDVVLLSDVLHHADHPALLLREAVRVAKRAVLLKDHLCFGRASRAMLLALDWVGNRSQGIAVPGRYASPTEWVEMIHQAGASVERLIWPLRIHARPLCYVTRNEHQFAMLLRPLGSPS